MIICVKKSPFNKKITVLTKHMIICVKKSPFYKKLIQTLLILQIVRTIHYIIPSHKQIIAVISNISVR